MLHFMRHYILVGFIAAMAFAPAHAELAAPASDTSAAAPSPDTSAASGSSSSTTASTSTPASAPAADAGAPAATTPAASAEPSVAPAPAPTAGGTQRAREALATKEGDVTSEKNLQEVFQSAEKQYSLLKSGGMSMDYSFNYSYFRDDRIDIAFTDSGQLSRFLIQQDAAHSFSNTFSFDYGIWDNLTLNAALPLVYKYDTQKNISGAALGDVSFGLRWQPFPLKRGAAVTTLFASTSTASGDSPYKINPNTDLASGKGYYAGSFGASTSKVLDPAVVFGSLSYTMGFDATGLDQARGSRVLTEVHPGDSISFSMGMAYSLSYDLSISVSYQQSYSFQTLFYFSNGDVVGSEDSTSASLSSSVGVRMSPQRIVNVQFGFGLTNEAPDVMLGFSLPIDITGIKQ